VCIPELLENARDRLLPALLVMQKVSLAIMIRYVNYWLTVGINVTVKQDVRMQWYSWFYQKNLHISEAIQDMSI